MTALLVTLALLTAPADARAHVTYPGCRTERCAVRVQRRMRDRTLRRWKNTVAPHDTYLNRIARCESGLRWTISTGNGYFGAFQFSLPSWQATGGSGYPHHASPLEQKYRAVRLSRLQGWGAWPRCRYA